ncbi:MAG: heme-binding protein [Acidobacteriota bacterium]
MACFRKLALLAFSTSACFAQLTQDDVRRIVENTAKAVDSNAMVIAVTDRQGDVLAVFRKPGAPEKAVGNFSAQVDTNELAVALARTAGFFSNSQAPLSSRTVRFISGVHFPPGILYTGNAALYGIENTNRGCFIDGDNAEFTAIPPARSIDGSSPGLGILTGKKDLLDSDPAAVNPGGVPIYKNGEVVGGVGVAGVSPEIAEYAAFIGSGVNPADVPAPGVVFIDGIALPFVDQSSPPNGIGLGTFESGTWIVDPKAAPGPAPEGDILLPRKGPVGGLSESEVRQIVDRAIAAANETRAVIRLPLGSKAKMVIAVADLDGAIIALHRMQDATFFSVDVALAKSRNVIYFSSKDRVPGDLPGVPQGTAVTNRTLGYGAQPFFPVGLDFTDPGPFFNLYKKDVENPCTQGSQPPNGRQNGIVFFPGALPLYRNGVLIGGLGVSGDGVEQDDFVTAAGAKGFEPPSKIRADRVIIDGVRLPYLKFPRNPTQ